MKISLLVLTLLSTSCIFDRNKTVNRTTVITPNDNARKIADINNKLKSINKTLSLMEQREALIESRLDLLESAMQLTQDLANSNSQAIRDLILPALDSIFAELYVLEDSISDLGSDISSNTTAISNINVELVSVSNTLSDLQQQLDTLKTTVQSNDTYVSIPGCQHSYFVLYNPNGNIQSVYVTEDDGTVNGAWELSNNTVYGLQIDGVTVCTGLQLDKPGKKLRFNNGTAQEINLSY